MTHSIYNFITIYMFCVLCYVLHHVKCSVIEQLAHQQREKQAFSAVCFISSFRYPVITFEKDCFYRQFLISPFFALNVANSFFILYLDIFALNTHVIKELS